MVKYGGVYYYGAMTQTAHTESFAALDIAMHYDLLDELKASIAERYEAHAADNFNR